MIQLSFLVAFIYRLESSYLKRDAALWNFLCNLGVFSLICYYSSLLYFISNIYADNEGSISLEVSPLPYLVYKPSNIFWRWYVFLKVRKIGYFREIVIMINSELISHRPFGEILKLLKRRSIINLLNILSYKKNTLSTYYKPLRFSFFS